MFSDSQSQTLTKNRFSACIKLVITKGYRVRAATIEGQNALAQTLCFA